MAAARDFRMSPLFDWMRVDAAGKNVGKDTYWKLYAIENTVRVLVHSILSQQVNANWWAVVADPKIQGDVKRRRKGYSSQPWHSTPGKHDVYYIFLSELGKIIASNSHLFRPHIKDIDNWVMRLEQIRLPRNIVGHMNWLTAVDRKRIDVVHSDLRLLTQKLMASGTMLSVPPA
jgi:hypothetical protein